VKRFLPQLFALCAFAVALLCGLHGELQSALSDFRFRWLSRSASGDVVLIAIDPRSLDALGVWPWPRKVHASLIRQLTSAKVKDIAFDVDFSSYSTKEADADFAAALQAAGGAVVLAEFVQSGGGHVLDHVNIPIPQFNSNAWSATVNVTPEQSGLVRQYRPGDYVGLAYEPSMAAVLAHSTDLASKPFYIDYGIRPETIPTVSYIDVIKGVPQVLAQTTGKTVMVGGTAIELGDHLNVPRYGLLPGPLIQALAAETLLQGRALHLPPAAVTFSGLGLLALIMLLVWPFSAIARTGVLLSLAVLIEIGSIIVQAKFPIIVDTAYFQIAIVCFLIAVALNEIDVRGLLGRIAENRFQKFAGSIGDGIVCADAQNRITVWNPGAAKIFGYEAIDAIGKPIDELWRGEATGNFRIANLSPQALRQPGGKTVEINGRRGRGETFPIEVCFSSWDTADGTHTGAVIRDVSVRKREEARIRYLAEHDALTGLLNRDALHSKANESLAQGNRERPELALLIVAITNFHQINDMFGHTCGDEVLCAVAQKLTSLVQDRGLLARLDGEEFAILVIGEGAELQAKALASRISASLGSAPLPTGDRQHRLAPSIGLAFYPEHCASAEELFGCAHLALDNARATGEPTQVVFDRDLKQQIEVRLGLEAELRRALAEGQFELHYQPQVRIADGSIVGAEALIRWRHPERGLIMPGDFMPIVNSSKLSDAVASWVLEMACRRGADWAKRGRQIRIGVNLCSSLVRSGSLVMLVKTILNDAGFPASLLELEVTEDILLDDSPDILNSFKTLRSLGVRIVFDDFGTGYASLSYLKKFPLDGLKIDRSFVSDLQPGSSDAAIVDCTIVLARLLGLSVIAEGIERGSTARLLAEKGCVEGQGYYFDKPMPADVFESKYVITNSMYDYIAGPPAAA
jgi:diguanylate cyclase (GGDEF)-like protein/PAS domain S-box-containing protein